METDKYKSILYSTGKSDINLILFEKKVYSFNRYLYKGFSYSNNDIDAYSWSSPKDSLFIVYGNNSSIKADKFIVYYDDGKSIVQNINSNNDFLFVFPLKKQIGIKCILYDVNGAIMKELL